MKKQSFFSRAGNLQRSFVAAAGIAAAGCQIDPQIPFITPEKDCDGDLYDIHRPADAEVAFLKDFYQLDFSRTLIARCDDPPSSAYVGGKLGAVVTANTKTGMVVHYTTKYYSEDFTKEDKPEALRMAVQQYGVFYQHKDDGLVDKITNPNSCTQPLYRISPLSDYDSSYCSQQQLSMLSDYTAHFLHYKQSPTFYYADADANGDHDTPETDALLIKTVEKKMPWLEELRLEAAGNIPTAQRAYPLPLGAMKP